MAVEEEEESDRRLRMQKSSADDFEGVLSSSEVDKEDQAGIRNASQDSLKTVYR